MNRSETVSLDRAFLDKDLSGLTPEQRVVYYKKTCESLNLNPLTKPFEYLLLNGKTVLYATKSCSEQLRQIHNVSLVLTDKIVADGCYCVTARATLPSGRQDESLGAVPIDKLVGENRANAMMKAETKAKRRVTLSICGLAFLDDNEVDSIPGAQRVPHDPVTGEVSASPQTVVAAAPVDPKLAQLERFAMHESALAAAKTLRELSDAWDSVNDDGKKARISLEQRASLLLQKDSRKKAIRALEVELLASKTEPLATELEPDPWELQGDRP